MLPPARLAAHLAHLALAGRAWPWFFVLLHTFEQHGLLMRSLGALGLPAFRLRTSGSAEVDDDQIQLTRGWVHARDAHCDTIADLNCLAAALRENLRKRKAQARAGDTPPAPREDDSSR